MGVQFRRVSLDFCWPIGTPWKGFVNEYRKKCRRCSCCHGSGYSPVAKKLSDQWYGMKPFSPQDNGSTPYKPTDGIVLERAKINVSRNQAYYVSMNTAIRKEADRLCGIYNSKWSHHLNEEDVAALLKGRRLDELTSQFVGKHDCTSEVSSIFPKAKIVNDWSIKGVGHDCINMWLCVKAACERLGESHICGVCQGEGHVWDSDEDKRLYLEWSSTEPPSGVGLQAWNTMPEGGPISPVFVTPEALASYLTENPDKVSKFESYESWLAMINDDCLMSVVLHNKNECEKSSIETADVLNTNF